MAVVAERAIEETLSELFGQNLLALTGGAVLTGAIATGIASHKTAKNRRKEKLFEKTGGLSGFSRTKANKEVTKNWSAAAVGTSVSIGGMAGGAALGTVPYSSQLLILTLILVV